MCRRTEVASEDGFLGYIQPARRVTIPARSEVVVWGCTRGARGQDYLGLVEALAEPGSVAAAWTISLVREGRGPCP